MCNAWAAPATSEEELIVLSVHRLRAQLYAWYPSYTHDEEGDPKATQLSDLTLKTLGPKGTYMLKTKGAMTRPLAPFCIFLLRRLNGVLANHGAVLKSGEALERILVVLKRQGRTVSAVAIQERAQFCCLDKRSSRTSDPTCSRANLQRQDLEIEASATQIQTHTHTQHTRTHIHSHTHTPRSMHIIVHT